MPFVTWPGRTLKPTCGDGASRTRLGQHLRRINTRSCQLPLMSVSCGVWRVRRCISAAVLQCPSCALVRSVLTSCLPKMCHLARRPNRGDDEHRTRPGEHRRWTNLRNCQRPSVLVSCGCVADVCDLCLSTLFGHSRLHSRSATRERAMCVQHTERNCPSRRRSTARVRHG